MTSPPWRCPWPRPCLFASIALAGWLSGCAQLDSDRTLFDPVAQATGPQLKSPSRWIRSEADRQAAAERIRELLAHPLDADDAVQVALLNHRGLQAALAELGIAQADVLQAGRLPNPGISLGRSRRGSELETRVGLELPLARLITLPLAVTVERRRLARVQRDAAQQVLGLAHATRRAHVQAVAASEGVRYLRQVQEVARAGADLGRRLREAGNWNRLTEAREQAFAAQADIDLATAVEAQQAALERLARLLGLEDGPAAFTLPERLPDLPTTLPDPAGLEAQALARRLDLQAARLDAEALASQLGLTRRTRFINVVDLGASRTRSNEQATERGYELVFELPLFDWGESRVARAEALYLQAVDRAAQAVVDARSEVRGAEAARRARFEVARRHLDEIVPLRRRIAGEQLLRHNGMLASVFELLADARAQITAVRDAIDASRDFWLAQADLDMALNGKAQTP